MKDMTEEEKHHNMPLLGSRNISAATQCPSLDQWMRSRLWRFHNLRETFIGNAVIVRVKVFTKKGRAKIHVLSHCRAYRQ